MKLKLSIEVSPRAVGKYVRNDRPAHTPDPKQRWLTFVRNHAKVVVACDFFVVITATFRTRRHRDRIPLHQNVTAHPTAAWTLHQFREALPGDHPYRFLIHDRDSIFAKDVDQGLANLGVRVLRTPVRAPKANALCERVGGSLRRECLDFLIPFNERHLRRILRERTTHYNRGRPHLALGPGLPQPTSELVPPNPHRHSLAVGYRMVKRSVLGGLHREYGLAK